MSALLEQQDQQDPNLYSGYRPPAAPATASAADVRSAAIRALGRIGSEGAVKALIGALAKDDPNAGKTAVRDALIEAGKPAASALVTLLGTSPSTTSAAGAALVLGALGATEGEAPIVRGMQRGTVPLRHGLRALAAMGSATALPSVLEQIDDSDPAVRMEAIRTASALLDPTKPDGRAVDPAREALKDAATPMDERIELVRMLGRTGAARAHEVLLPLAKAKSTSLRLAVVEALGVLRAGSPAVDAALLEALGDEQPDIRQKAAIALSRVGTGASAVEAPRAPQRRGRAGPGRDRPRPLRSPRARHRRHLRRQGRRVDLVRPRHRARRPDRRPRSHARRSLGKGSHRARERLRR